MFNTLYLHQVDDNLELNYLVLYISFNWISLLIVFYFLNIFVFDAGMTYHLLKWRHWLWLFRDKFRY